MVQREVPLLPINNSESRAKHATAALALVDDLASNTLASVESQLGRRLLVVGEGDFSLSQALVRRHRDASNLTATSFRRSEQTRVSFPAAIEKMTDLMSRGATILHNVDASSLRKSDGIRDNYDLIFFAFPFAENANGTEYTPKHRHHANLIAKFLRNASTILRNEGEVALVLHVSSKGVAQFDSWKVATAAKGAQLQLVGQFDGLEYEMEGYLPHKGSGALFSFNRARTYVFRRALMNVVYGVFAQELEDLRQHGSQRGDCNASVAAELRL